MLIDIIAIHVQSTLCYADIKVFIECGNQKEQINVNANFLNVNKNPYFVCDKNIYQASLKFVLVPINKKHFPGLIYMSINY